MTRAPSDRPDSDPHRIRGVHDRVLDWYAVHGRDLPWRRPDASPWGVYVSEIMAQQTPIARILAPWRAWMARWPTPAALAGDSVAEAIRAWDRLGYPRRAVNLHAAARVMVRDHGGEVPHDPEVLLTLPGVGAYTAAAVASFAHGIPTPVLDTNVRRVLARIALGEERAAPSQTRAERDLAAAWLPPDTARANVWNVASMELGALVCTARSPRCGECPVADLCVWRRAGHPAYAGPVRRPPGYAGTDREIRGAVLAVVRTATAPVPLAALSGLCPQPRLRRCLDALVTDGLLAVSRDGYDLPR
ncbi:MAG: A/G-specific adenine glycosylase [Dermatophilaceae bacterium]